MQNRPTLSLLLAGLQMLLLVILLDLSAMRAAAATTPVSASSLRRNTAAQEENQPEQQPQHSKEEHQYRDDSHNYNKEVTTTTLWNDLPANIYRASSVRTRPGRPDPAKTINHNNNNNNNNNSHTTTTTTPTTTTTTPRGYFTTLECNDKQNPVSSSSSSLPSLCESWTSLFGTASFLDSKVTIPCGQCVVMDKNAPSIITVKNGLDVQGTLVFPDQLPQQNKITIHTPFLFVQGALHMTSRKMVNGEETIRIVLTGTNNTDDDDDNEHELVPIDRNALECNNHNNNETTSSLSCGVGTKAVVVAGGRLVLDGLPPDTPTWMPLYDVVAMADDDNDDDDNTSTIRGIVLSDRVQQKWGVGAEVLLTSHTLSYRDDQVRRITNIDDYYYENEPGHVVLTLDRPIRRPTTLKDHPDFAIEVALLSRNIVFEGDDDKWRRRRRHGAHLMIFHTPLVPQRLNGVEFRNFGQQGILGRYPIHFHMCDNVTGSIVSNNLIRDSHQRCIVVHSTHNLLIEGNVAYNTSGHCFLTEDGNEQNNTFSRNLGARTRRVQDVIPDNGANGEETDDKPATFWMTNPTNTWEGNVAAGSEASGFWLELRPTVRGTHDAERYRHMNPKTEPLTLFRDNVAHSNRDKGMRTYPTGYIPDEQAVFLNSRFYRNEGDGFWIHHSHNIAVVGGVYADSRRQLDFDRAEKITFRDALVIGVSPEYRSLSQSQRVPSVCTRKKTLAGVQFHSFTRDSSHNGAVLSNITVTGFANSGCSGAAAFDFDDQVERGNFDYFTTLSKIFVEDDAVPINLCQADAAGVTDIYITDLDSSARPKSSSFTGTSTIVSDNPRMKAFTAQGSCVSIPDQCYAYCFDTCFRTITYAVDPAGTDDYKLRVCSVDSPTTCVEVPETMFYREKARSFRTAIFRTRFNTRRYFSVSLPKGNFSAAFLDPNGNEAWPSFVDETYEDALCEGGLGRGALGVKVTPLVEGECDNLIRNGDAEDSVNHTHWLHRKGGIAVAVGQGINGSNAFTDLQRRDKDKDGIAQFLDSRCLAAMVGRTYEINAWVKLADESGGTYLCDRNKEDCPEVDIYTFRQDKRFSKQSVAGTVSSYESRDFQLVHGVMDITSDHAAATSVMFSVQRNKRKKLVTYVDHISMDLMPDLSSSSSCDGNLVWNGDFATGDSRFWLDKGHFTVVSPGRDGVGDFAMASPWGEMSQYIQSGCMRIGAQFEASAVFQLVERGVVKACHSGEQDCPVMKLRSQNSLKSQTLAVARTVDEPPTDGWMRMWGSFEISEPFASADKIKLLFDGIGKGVDFVVDNVVVLKVQKLEQDAVS